MGAQQFEHAITISKKTTTDAAFRQAVEDAKYAHGHEGYSGTLAEKGSYVLLHTAKSQANARRLMAAYQDHSNGFSPLRQEEIDRVDDKWGPAGVIRFPIDTTTDGLLIFGWASS